MIRHASEDQLIDLAAGLLAAAAAETALAHLRDCPACEERFRGVCRELERTRLAAAPAAAKRRLVALGTVGALAAAVLAAAILVPVLRSRGGTDPVSYWIPVESAVDLRAATPGGNDSVFAEATEAYRRHDAAQVVELLAGKTIPSSHDPLKLLQASALLKTGDAGGALDVLEALRIHSLPQPYRDRAKWIRLGALRARGLDAEAEALAAEIASRPGEFADAAREIQSGSPSRKNPAQ